MGLFRQPSGDITSGVIWKQLLAFFFPLWLGTFFQQLYNTVDTLVVGRLVGKTALAALNDYTRQRREGKEPVFRAQDIGLEGQTDFWR